MYPDLISLPYITDQRMQFLFGLLQEQRYAKAYNNFFVFHFERKMRFSCREVVLLLHQSACDSGGRLRTLMVKLPNGLNRSHFRHFTRLKTLNWPRPAYSLSIEVLKHL